MAISIDLLRKYDRPGPRYTSYPTAIEFHAGFGTQDYEQKLAEANQDADAPLSLYIHLPFCEERCSFCGCHVVITKKRPVAGTYLDYLHREIALVAARLPARRRVTQLHLGGGTPTYQSPEDLRALYGVLAKHFDIEPDAEVAIEVDPRVTTHAQIDTLRDLGFNRLSMGVQDFTPDVQKAIGRNQSETETRDLFGYSRDVGFDSINLDLIYGLPKQTPESFQQTLSTTIELRPDRVALYSFAFVPWIKGNQRSFTEEMLPDAETKMELFHLALTAFDEAGYRQIGMDHFALPTDELSMALDNRTLHRNFMGYTTKPASDMIGLGVSAIGDLCGAYVQNEKKLPPYYAAIDAGQLPVLRGCLLDDDDQIRRHVITRLMCNFHLDVAEVEARFDLNFATYFASELEDLAEPASHGLVAVTPTEITVTRLGRLLVRNVCMVFDRYHRETRAGAHVFSRTV